MGKHYSQLSLVERKKIELLREQGLSSREIGAQLGRSASTISREIRRNAQPTNQWRGCYGGERADQLAARRRRWDARFKLTRQPALQGGQAGHRPPAQLLGTVARKPAAFHHLRQWHRVCRASSADRQARNANLFLRPSRTLAERQRREHNWTDEAQLPRKTNLADTTSQEIEAHADWVNSIPRECLDFFTPDDLFSKNLSVALQA